MLMLSLCVVYWTVSHLVEQKITTEVFYFKFLVRKFSYVNFLVPWLARRPNVLPITSLWELCNKYISCHTVEKKLDFVSCIIKSFSQFSITKITKMNKLPSNISVILYYKKENKCIIPLCFLQNSILFSPKFLQNYWISLLWNRRF